jgi:hypothetical protein
MMGATGLLVLCAKPIPDIMENGYAVLLGRAHPNGMPIFPYSNDGFLWLANGLLQRLNESQDLESSFSRLLSPSWQGILPLYLL